MNILIESIQRKNIFCEEFQNLTNNNSFDFTNKNICVIYGPNGTGKTSLAMILNQEPETQYSINIDGQKFTEKENKFAHIIEDQNGRNIISGETKDFLIGDNIKLEYELKQNLNQGFRKLFEDEINVKLKNYFGISTKDSWFLSIIKNETIKPYISNIANIRQKGKDINWKEFLKAVSEIIAEDIPEFDEGTFSQMIEDLKSKESIIRNFLALDFSNIKQEPIFEKIEETKDAVNILEKYKTKKECIVCDTEVDCEKQLAKKKNQNKHAVDSLSTNSKKLLQDVLEKAYVNDIFFIKEKIKIALESGNTEGLFSIRDNIIDQFKIYSQLIQNQIKKFVNESKLQQIIDQYSKLLEEKLEFQDEDVIFIENFLNECLERKIHLERDKENNLVLLLGDEEFLKKDRKNIGLSNGEQNFLSLAFELLRAQKSEKEIIILDDPISSFDSIYKNKIAYAIIKFLQEKNVLILTHSTDLIKLLEHQHQKCFNLYYLNNTQGEENGFILINEKEIKILLYIHEFLQLLRNDISQEIINEKAFIISLIPFMRGYCQIINNIEYKNQLTKVMHGYETERVNITAIYSSLFSSTVISNKYEITSLDIINSGIDENDIILNSANYPLLNKTLIHSYNYLFLRMTVEKKLVDKFHIDTKKNQLLSQIITASFNGNDLETIKKRVFFLSRKTLLNEFNHFEMDMNVFQPAIDITNKALAKERSDILAKLDEI